MPRARGCSTSQVRSRPGRCGCARSGSAPWPPGCCSPPRRTSAPSSARSRRPTRRSSCVDSVQTVSSTAVDGAPGGVSQVREVAAALIKVAKERGIPAFLVGHVTKDGAVAGPRTLEHLVDVVCQVDGERHTRLRLLRATKNRFGPTDEVGCFDLTDTGIVELSDPSGLFLSHGTHQVPGTCVTVTLEGRRPLATEIQALVVPSLLTNPRRTTSGVDSSRLAMVLAVAQRRAALPLARPRRLRLDRRRRPRRRTRGRPGHRARRGQRRHR